MPLEDASPQEKAQALFIYRKITVLRCVPCCGMCGSMRHHTKPYWCLGMRVCRHCIQANLVSSSVMYERYWLTFDRPVQNYRSLVDAVCMNVFYFSTRLTPFQRLDFSCDPIDFPGGVRSIWFFWKPHLANILNMTQLEREGKEKHQAASVVRAYTRRALILRALRGTKDKRAPTYQSTQVFSKRDLRCTEFRIRRTSLLDKVDTYNEQRFLHKLPLPIFSRLSAAEDKVPQTLLKRLTAAEDRVTPFMFN
jgi:hypothetical protein